MKAERKAYPTFCICIVTYCPSDICIQRIHQLRDKWPVWIFDNTPNGKLYLESSEMVRVFRTGNNEGLGYAMNFLLTVVNKFGIDCALYFDQDTQYSAVSIEWISEWMVKNAALLNAFPLLNFLPDNRRINTELACQIVNPVKLLINSGSLYYLPKLKNLGFHNKNWFLECVDFEFCFRLAQRGYGIAHVTGCPDLDHLSEQPTGDKHRLYPMKRSFFFILKLLQLSFRALVFGPREYSWIFARNVITHVIHQFTELLIKVKRKVLS